MHSFRPDRVRGSSTAATQVSRRWGSVDTRWGGPPVVLEASLDRRAALMAAGLRRRDGRRQIALPAHRVEPRKVRRLRHAGAVLRVKLLEGVRLVHARTSTACLRRAALPAPHVAMPWRLLPRLLRLPAAASAVTRLASGRRLRHHGRLTRLGVDELGGRRSQGRRGRGQDSNGEQQWANNRHESGSPGWRPTDSTIHGRCFVWRGLPG